MLSNITFKHEDFPEETWTALTWAAISEKYEALEVLLQNRKVNKNHIISDDSDIAETALSWQASANKKKVVENVNEVKDLAPLLYTCLSLHIGKPEAQKAMNYFSGIEAQYLNSLSLDDIEEIASIKQEGES